MSDLRHDLRQQALDYHAQPIPGKIAIALTKPAETARDLALTYSPGVAEPVREPVAALPGRRARNLDALAAAGLELAGVFTADSGALDWGGLLRRENSDIQGSFYIGAGASKRLAKPVLSLLLLHMPVRHAQKQETPAGEPGRG